MSESEKNLRGQLFSKKIFFQKRPKSKINLRVNFLMLLLLQEEKKSLQQILQHFKSVVVAVLYLMLRLL
jgi:hypothetical protein